MWLVRAAEGAGGGKHPNGGLSSKRVLSSTKRVCTICLIHEMLDGGFLFFKRFIPKFGEDGSI